METRQLSYVICFIIISIFFNGKLHSQGFVIKDISDKVSIVSNPDLGNQVVVRSDKGLVVFDSFWSEKTATLFKEEIVKFLGRNDFSYVINMADRLDMIGGNDVYKGAVVIGHENIQTKYSDERLVKKEISELVKMWQEKETYSSDRLKKLETGSEKALKEENWLNKCKTMAEELQNSFSLVLPEISYNDKITLDLGNIKMNLFWFGNAGNYQGLTMVVIPEEKLAIISKAIIYPRAHLASYPFPYYEVLDVTRWIAVMEQILEGKTPVNNVILSDSYEVYSRELMHSHLEYIRKLWNEVKTLESKGMTLQEIKDQLSLEKDFAFVKEMEVYKNNGDNWIRPQHEMHVRLFFLQGKNLASEIIKAGGPESVLTSMDKIKKLGNDTYFDEISNDFLGYEWMNSGKTTEAIEVYKLNVEAFPGSFKAYSSLGAAYMKKGDTENAIKNFKKSLELNPNNKNVEMMLKSLETR